MMFNSNLNLLSAGHRVYYADSHMGSTGWLTGTYHTGLFGYNAWFVSGIILLAVVALIVVLVSARKRKRTDVLEPLKQRFINGEITEEEYLNKKAIILK
ncbi:MAG: SHOCT domain-containing protein [Eubacteriales bacterium]